jgi:hypothetical protein
MLAQNFLYGYYRHVVLSKNSVSLISIEEKSDERQIKNLTDNVARQILQASRLLAKQ